MNDIATFADIGRCSGDELGPSLRVALCRRAGQLSRVAAADVARQLREVGCMAVQIDALPPPQEELDADRAAIAGYDVVVAVGDCLEPARRLADALDIPLVHVPIPVRPGVERLVERAAAGPPPGVSHHPRQDPPAVEGGRLRLRRAEDGR